ncbi:cytochrome p450 [Moniliophthora roreri MCA 2997]|uniref:Cytochrome p450 n=2 Tax=Moniliophthora roreri TaxID=221103 RepID=V2X7Q6_MONRO|nr:cytochrome p450 [Moniliophthora roreri MCA 2997]
MILLGNIGMIQAATVILLAAFLVQAIVRKTLSLVKAFRSVGTSRGRYPILLHPHLLTTYAVAPYFPPREWFGHYYTTFDFYAKHGSTCLSSVSLLDSTPVFWVSDPDAFKVVSMEYGRIFEKDMAVYHSWTGPGLNFFGDNIVGSHGQTWKRHRMIANPAFNEGNISRVWRETIRVVNEWMSAIDNSTVDICIELDVFEDLKRVTTLIFTSAAFGKNDPWKSSSAYDLSYLLGTAERLLVAKIFLPEWIYSLTDLLHIPILSPLAKLTKTIYRALNEQLLELVSSSRANLLENKYDSDGALLKAFIKANMDFEPESVSARQRHLTDQELLANMFIFMNAGNETTAATTSMALVYLALYPDFQDRLFCEVLRVWPDGVPNRAADLDNRTMYPKLTYTIAFINETLRHFPAASRLGRVVLKDTSLPAQRFRRNSNSVYETEPYSVPIPSGSRVCLDFGALHMNPLYWGDDATEFNPDKFIDTEVYQWPREAFAAFSLGPRSCIGQRFAMTESVCMLACIVRKYRIMVPEDLVDKPFEEQRRVLLKWKPKTANVPVNARVRLCRR